MKLFNNDFDGIPYLFTHTNLLAAVPGTPTHVIDESKYNMAM
jgi:hypothetical protein